MLGKWKINNHVVVVNDYEVMDVISAINRFQNFALFPSLIVRRCDTRQWKIDFNTSDNRWTYMVNEIEKIKSAKIRD